MAHVSAMCDAGHKLQIKPIVTYESWTQTHKWLQQPHTHQAHHRLPPKYDHSPNQRYHFHKGRARRPGRLLCQRL
jgi:hypothetical protein